MKNGYKLIEVDIGTQLDEVIKLLRNYDKQSEKVCVEFNDHFLYSDSTDEDEIYKLITKKTKTEFEQFVANEEKRMVDKFKVQ